MPFGDSDWDYMINSIGNALRDRQNSRLRQDAANLAAAADTNYDLYVQQLNKYNALVRRFNALADKHDATNEANRRLSQRLSQQENQGKRLSAQVEEAEAIVAKGEAAPTAEEGKAVAEVLAATAAAWRKMGPQAREIYVIQHLEQIVGTIVSHLRKIDVEEVNILDPGDGSGLASYAASYPQTIAAVLRALAETTGVDVPALLSDRRTGQSNGSSRPPAATAPSASTSPTAPRSVP